jgi:hypothetical protein
MALPSSPIKSGVYELVLAHTAYADFNSAQGTNVPQGSILGSLLLLIFTLLNRLFI